MPSNFVSSSTLAGSIGEVLVAEGLEITAIAGVADENLVALGELALQCSEDRDAICGVLLCLLMIAADDVAPPQHSRTDLAVLPRSQGLSPSADQAGQGRSASALRSYLHAPHRLRHPRPSARSAPCQQGANCSMVLERPEVPLHNNGSENDIRECQGASSAAAPEATRAALPRRYVGLRRRAAKLGVAFWDYLGSRLAVPNHHDIPDLPTLVSHRCASA